MFEKYGKRKMVEFLKMNHNLTSRSKLADFEYLNRENYECIIYYDGADKVRLIHLFQSGQNIFIIDVNNKNENVIYK